jgi:hypothetical protein
MEEVAGVVWTVRGDIAAVARETTCEPLAAPLLGFNCRALGSGGRNVVFVHDQVRPFEICLAVVCWLLRLATAEGKFC